MRFRQSLADEEAEVMMAPLIDCVFILLIFFLVTSLLLKPHKEVPIKTPFAGVAVTAAEEKMEPLSIVVTATDPDLGLKAARRVRSEPFILLEGDLMTRELLERRLGQVAQQTPNRAVRIDTDPTMKWRYVMPVVDLCKFHGLVNVSIRMD